MDKEELAKILEQARNEANDDGTAKKIDRAIVLARQKKTNPEDAMSLICFGSLVFCCATPTDKSSGLSCAGKNCFWRDAAMILAGITPDKLNKLKAKWHKELLERK